MYEIWLMLNILYEIALGLWPLLLAVLVAWLVLLMLTRQRLSLAVLRPSLGVAAVATIVLFFSLPALTHSSLANVDYWVDWVTLFGIALGLGALIGLFALPLLAWLRPANPRITA